MVENRANEPISYAFEVVVSETISQFVILSMDRNLATPICYFYEP